MLIQNNFYSFEIQNQLRKKSYNFTRTDKIVDNFFKLRDAQVKGLDPPPEKKTKLEETGWFLDICSFDLPIDCFQQ